MRSSRKLWYGIGAFILTSGTAAAGGEAPPIEPAVSKRVDHETRLPIDAVRPLRAELRNAWAQAGEDGAGGEGGEGGINLETVGNDAAEYAIALQVIAAHYDAGLAAYAGGEQEAGAQMFAHGLSEIYAVMEELFKKLGVTKLGPSLEAAVADAADKKPLKDIRRRVDEVRKALQDAGRRGPQAASPNRMQAYIVGELIERAAAQYAVSLNDKTLEPYLDGLGFAIAARREAAPVLASLRTTDKRAEAALQNALKLVLRAYPGIKRPAAPAVPASEMLVAASRARLAVSAYR